MREIRTDGARALRVVALLRKGFGLPIAGRNIGAGPHVDPPPSTTDWGLWYTDNATGEHVILLDAITEALDDDDAAGDIAALRTAVLDNLTIAERIELRLAVRAAKARALNNI